MAVIDLREDVGSTKPEGYYENRRREYNLGNTFWRRAEFDPDEYAERIVQLWSGWKMLGFLSVLKANPLYEKPGLSAVAFAFELNGKVALNVETIKPDENADLHPVAPTRAAAVLTQYCAEQGRLAS